MSAVDLAQPPQIVIQPVPAWSSATSSLTRAASSAPRFDRHCQAEFEYLARNDFDALVTLISSELQHDRVLLSFALEALHLVGDPTRVTPLLLGFLRHSEPVVREGAIIGLQPYLSSSRMARDMIKGLRDNDPSDGVRRAAADALLLLDP